ncbi:MAG: amidohydrolase family protein, partial [Candidatus Obscuribacterales bacterium]|nr:amidohydrolase family protein [Candidatus Obscuribacterales bacterium]
GLLGCRSILAHSIHLSDSELSVIKNKDCALAHCPSSNFFLKSGVFPYARVKAEAIKFGLGSDVAAGPQMSMFQVMKDANYIQPLDWLDARELLYRSTLGAARALGLQEQTGSLQIGKDADFIVVDPGLRTGIAADILSQLTDEILSSMVFLGDDRIIVATYLRGKSLYKI